ncbi:MAG: carbon-nitrogen hydrolase family protein [Phycisphaerae bacterium]|nr:carbon-nitrogen hydrolase family protein [Phycisphaerae bacterium]
MRQWRIAALQSTWEKHVEPACVEKNLEWTVQKIRELKQYSVEVVCLAEIFATCNLAEQPARSAQDREGNIVQTMLATAKELQMAILCPLYEKRDHRIYNTVIVIDKTGQIVESYDKIHPTEDEMDRGIVPGKTEPTVIELEGVKIGCQICFDANWPGDWLALKHAGARMIFFCSAFSAGTLLQGYATILGLPIIAATSCRDCRIYDRTGAMIAHQSPYYDFVFADVLIDQPLFHLDYQFEVLDCIRRDHPEIGTNVFNGEGRWTFDGVRDPKVFQNLIDHYKLLDVDAYLTRAQEKQDQMRR